MSELKRTGYPVYEFKYRFVWIPKYRKKVLTEEIKEKLKEIFLQITEEYDFEIEDLFVKSNLHRYGVRRRRRNGFG